MNIVSDTANIFASVLYQINSVSKDSSEVFVHLTKRGVKRSISTNNQCCGSGSERIMGFFAESEIFVPVSDSVPDPVI